MQDKIKDVLINVVVAFLAIELNKQNNYLEGLDPVITGLGAIIVFNVVTTLVAILIGKK